MSSLRRRHPPPLKGGRRIEELQAVLQLAREDDQWIRRIREKGYLLWIRPAGPERLTVQSLEFALEQAKTRKAVLQGYTRVRTVRELEGGLARSRSLEAAEEMALERELALRTAILKQIAACTVTAPAEGACATCGRSRRVRRSVRGTSCWGSLPGRRGRPGPGRGDPTAGRHAEEVVNSSWGP
jgi:hypothetical protein